MLSAKVIVLNEERNLPECLASIAFADEIVVVDSHSTDRTEEIARQAGARYFNGDFIGIADKKRFALERCAGDWVLSVDADERVTPELRRAVEDVVRSREQSAHAAGYFVTRRSRHMGRWVRYGEWNPDRVLRLVRREGARYGGTDPHLHLEVDGPTALLGGDLIHYVYRDFSHQMATVQRYAQLSALDMFQKGRRFSFTSALFRPWLRFFKTYVLKRGFMDGLAGLAIAYSSLYYDFAKFACLRELEETEKREEWAPTNEHGAEPRR